MAIQLKNSNNTEENTQDNIREQETPEEKFRGGLGDGTVDIDKINDLPAYTAPPVMETGKGNMSGAERRSLIYKILGVILLLVVGFGIYKGVSYITGSGGKDITAELSKTDSEIASDLKITFEDNPERLKAIPQYASGTVTVKSGKDLHIIYLKDKQVGVNTDSRKYRFFGVGINDSEKHALENMTYQYDDSFAVLNDIMAGNSDTYFYYNRKNNDCFVLTINKGTARVVNMTYFTEMRKMTSGLDFN